MKSVAISLVISFILIGFGCTSETVDDAGISAKVKAKLAADSETSAIKIGVDTINKVVTLSGVVPTEREKAKAEQLARNTEAVAQVVNNITVNPSTLGATNVEEKARDAVNKVEEKARSAASSVEGMARDAAGDAGVLAKIKTKILTEGIIGTNVDVVEGAVTLKGEVETEQKRTLAGDIARSTSGVKSVNNQLTVKKKK